jgi:hypothetical protein
MQLIAVGSILRTSLSDLGIRGARRRERAALARLGESLALSKTAGADPALRNLLTRVAKIRLQVEAFSEDISRSVEADLADYASAGWARPLVAVRGRWSRAILRYRRTLCHGGLRPLHEALGRAAMQKFAGQRASFGVPGRRAAAVDAARWERESAAADQARYFAPSEGTLARWMTALAAAQHARPGDRPVGRPAQVLPDSDAIYATSVNEASAPSDAQAL